MKQPNAETSSEAVHETDNNFVESLLNHSDNSTAISEVIFTPENALYSSILNFYIKNLRFKTPDTPKPQAIITPVNESQIQTVIFCAKKHGLEMRIRSGGHDFEGSSYVSDVPFLVLDMFNFKSISIDAEDGTAWVGAGATVGELYYAIHEFNGSLAFPAGYWPTVGIGGHISGGGYGPLVRKYGLAADNVVDARVIDANGRILDRKSMDEDFFWAIRGGVGANFCVVLSFKVKLVEIPEKVAAFTVKRTLEQNATKLVHKWQCVAPKLPQDIILSLQITSISSDQPNRRTIEATFVSVFLGEVDKLVELMEEHFPELGLLKEECTEMRWIEYFAYHMGLPIESTPKFLQTRVSPVPLFHFKSKADFVQDPIPEKGLEEIWDFFFQVDAGKAVMEWTPLGGRMDEIPESEIPYPHREGNKFIVYKKIKWNSIETTFAQDRKNWMTELHSMMGKYVADNPRGGFACYRDLDLGVNNREGYTTVDEAKVWGEQYFKNNFDRLVKVKTMVDPENFFKNEQSIPPSASHSVLVYADLGVGSLQSLLSNTMSSKISNPISVNQNTFENPRLTGRRKSDPLRLVFNLLKYRKWQNKISR